MSCFKWYAIQVRPRKENAVHASLLMKGYECLLPVRSYRTLTTSGTREVRSPLFTGYLFCRLDVEQNLRALLFTPDVKGLVGVRGVPCAMENREVESIRQLSDSSFPIEAWPYIRAGSQVQLLAGPLCGLQGFVIEDSKITRIVVSVELLQRSIAVEIPSVWARPRPALESLT